MGERSKLSHNSNTTLFLSCLLHGIILFTILTVLFLKVISVIAANAFKTTLNTNVNNAFQDKKFGHPIIGSLFKPPLDRLHKLYSEPESTTSAYNQGLVDIMIFGIVAGVVGFGGACLLLYFSCGEIVPFWFIIIENLVIFLFVGIFETYFFFTVGKKYVPVPPSFLINRLYSNIKNV